MLQTAVVFGGLFAPSKLLHRQVMSCLLPLQVVTGCRLPPFRGLPVSKQRGRRCWGWCRASYWHCQSLKRKLVCDVFGGHANVLLQLKSALHHSGCKWNLYISKVLVYFPRGQLRSRQEAPKSSNRCNTCLYMGGRCVWACVCPYTYMRRLRREFRYNLRPTSKNAWFSRADWS